MIVVRDLLATRDVVIPMPEGGYAATVDIWKVDGVDVPDRHSIKVSIPLGIPHPGKNENSWDQDDDACYSVFFVHDGKLDIDEWVRDAIGAAMKAGSRFRRFDWQPKVLLDSEGLVVEVLS